MLQIEIPKVISFLCNGQTFFQTLTKKICIYYDVLRQSRNTDYNLVILYSVKEFLLILQGVINGIMVIFLMYYLIEII